MKLCFYTLRYNATTLH